MDSVIKGVQRHSVNTIPLPGEQNEIDALSEHSSESLNEGDRTATEDNKNQNQVEREKNMILAKINESIRREIKVRV